MGLATAQELKAIDDKVQAIVDEAVEFAENSPEPDASELRRYVFAEE